MIQAREFLKTQPGRRLAICDHHAPNTFFFSNDIKQNGVTKLFFG